MADKPIIVITQGDPCGIGPEVVTKALATGEIHPLCRPVVMGSAWAMEQAVKLVGAPLRVRRIESVAEGGENPGTIDVLDPGNLSPSDITVGQVSAACGRAVTEWRVEATRLVSSGEAQGIVMAPINSEAIQLAGVPRTGDGQQGYLFLINGPLRIVHFTDHIPYAQVRDEVKQEKLVPILQLIHDSLGKWGVPNPRIGVAGLNAHAMGAEDREEIAPAVQEAQRRGINAIGPVSPDTVFRQCIDGLYDVVLAMYHDQGHIAIKTYKFEGILSISLGRPFIGTSVAHGTAFDIAGKGIANPASILASIKTCATLASGKGFPKE